MPRTTKTKTKELKYGEAQEYVNKKTKKYKSLEEEYDALEIPTLCGGEFHWNFEKPKMSLTDKVTWVLTAVNVAILISLIVKNTMYDAN